MNPLASLFEQLTQDLPSPREVRAHHELAELGSVMARPEQPEWRRNLSPLAGTAMDALDAAASGFSPLDAADPRAMITAGAWRAMDKPARAALNVLANRFPGFFRKVLQHPDSLFVRTGRLPQGTAGKYYSPDPGKARVLLDERAAQDPRTLIHELQHMFDRASEPFRYAPEEAYRLGQRAYQVLPKGGRESLGRGLKTYPRFQELKQSLLPAERIAEEQKIVNSLVSEARAHVAEALAGSRVSPQLRSLAEELGISIRGR